MNEPRTVYGEPYKGRYIDILMWDNLRYGWQYNDDSMTTAGTVSYTTQEKALKAAQDEIDQED